MEKSLDELPDQAEVVVVGLGLMGSAATWALARRGHSVVALDANPAGHKRGSSHGSARIFRRAYLEPEYVSMSGQALKLWRRLEREAHCSLLTMTGGLYHGPEAFVQRQAEVLAAAEVEHTILHAGQASERWPHMRFEGAVIHHAEAGVLDPELAMTAQLRLAAAAGARIAHNAPVAELEPVEAGARVKVASKTVRAQQVVVAAGPWLPNLLHGVRMPPLTVTQQQVFHFARRTLDEPTLWPVVDHDIDGNIYALPGGRDGLTAGNMKLGEHTYGTPTSAEGRDGVIDAASRRRVIEYVGHWWPGLLPEPVAEYSCLYTWTRNADFFIDRDGSFVVCSACSGHGAKFAPLIGELVADLVEDRGLPVERFSRTHHGV